jgi:hypothetical protein
MSRILHNPTVHNRAHNSSPPVPVLSHINANHALQDPFRCNPPSYSYVTQAASCLQRAFVFSLTCAPYPNCPSQSLTHSRKAPLLHAQLPQYNSQPLTTNFLLLIIIISLFIYFCVLRLIFSANQIKLMHNIFHSNAQYIPQ